MSKVHLLESRGSMYYVVVLHTEGPCGYGGAVPATTATYCRCRRSVAARGEQYGAQFRYGALFYSPPLLFVECRWPQAVLMAYISSTKAAQNAT
mgnify:FL=1